MLLYLFSLIPPPPPSTLFPYTTLFRSAAPSHLETHRDADRAQVVDHVDRHPQRAPEPSRAAQDVVVRRLEVRSRRSEEHTSELQSPCNLVCRLLLEKKKHT